MAVTFLKRLFPIILFITILGGCAVSGGSSSAHFTSKNSQEIVLSPFYLSDPSAGGDHAWYMKLQISDKIPVAGFLKPNQMLMESFTRWFTALKPVAWQVLSSSNPSTATGCAGSFFGQIDMQVDGEFKGVLTFADYADDCTLVLDGQVPFHGEMNLISGEVETELSLPPLPASLDEKKLQLAGALRLKFNAFKGERQLFNLESTLTLADETGLRFSLVPLTFNWDRSGQYPQTTMEGQIVVVPYGMVRLATSSPMQISPKRNLPFDGSLLFHGANDSWIRVLFPKPGLPGFFRIDGSDGLETIGQL